MLLPSLRISFLALAVAFFLNVCYAHELGEDANYLRQEENESEPGSQTRKLFISVFFDIIGFMMSIEIAIFCLFYSNSDICERI